ncbi:MAG: hypothetical protein H6742_04045 [Alphaproteobacteria bacterium]|nr:hypothetical protein [Alphaproteobacteria bacterium]
MSDRLVRIHDDFWNIRGAFKIAGFVDIGTQCSLVRRRDGSFLLLDAYTLQGDVLDQVMAATDDGRAVTDVLHLHPFHTIHVPAVAAQFPAARHSGSRRHKARAPDLAWTDGHLDEAPVQARFADDLQFSVPAGVDFIAADEKLHFSSVLAFHPASGTLHVDDTLTWSSVPLFSGLIFHPTLKKVLQPRPGAVAEFRAWAQDLVARCADVQHLCTAHMRPLPPAEPVAPMVEGALQKVEGVLRAHSRAHDPVS